MKLIKSQFEQYAKEQGYTGAEIFNDLNLNVDAYNRYKKEVPIGKATLRTLCWELGATQVTEFVRFENDERERYRFILEEF